MITLINGEISVKISEENELLNRCLLLHLFGLEIYGVCLNNARVFRGQKRGRGVKAFFTALQN